jgi:regulator of protease activity HflC (stomatin/prohibitin superfamily)
MNTTYFDPQLITLGLLALIFLLVIVLGIQKVPDGNARVVERLGKRHRTIGPGISFIIPFIDTVKKRGVILETYLENGGRKLSLIDAVGNISIAENRMDPRELKLLGKDNSEIFVDSVAYFKISDPIKAVYDVASLSDSFLSLIETTLRQEVGKLDGDTVVTSRDVLSDRLRESLQSAATNWGVTVFRVEVEDIRFDDEVSKKLSDARKEELVRRAELVAAQATADQRVIEAEAEKKSRILKAEGEKQAEIAKAEGDKEAQILRAQGQFEEQRLQAEAQFLLQSREQEGVAKGYAAIVESISKNSEAVLALEQVKAQIKVAESLGNSSNALIIPAESAGLFGAVSAAIKGFEQITRK